jgi:4-diphosphocytidyl-2C-methyl-D-erythritol kinase
MKARSADWPCEGSMMSGSGTSFFAVCSNAEQADSLARRLRAAGDDRVFAVTSL